MTKLGWLGVLIAGILGGFLGSSFFSSPSPTHDTQTETAYERVMKTKTLRCGFATWEPGVRKDTQSGKMSGAWVNITEEIAKIMDLKVEWAAEVGWGDVSTALKTGKIDAMCAGMWESGLKAKELYFSTPAAYEGIEAFIRRDDTRFGEDIRKLNDPSVRIIVMERDNPDFVADTNFPRAEKITLPQLSGDGDMLTYVISNKADVAFVSPDDARRFNKTNNNKIIALAPGHYLRVFGQTLAFNNDDPRLWHAVNIATNEAINAGIIARVLAPYRIEHPERFLTSAPKLQE